ncbi:MAG: NAD(+) kinase, partial [Cytophagales bacterium CG18_big_fil_WC_8_21_14_2_50_42_9]
MRIAILGKPFEEKLVPYILGLFNELAERKAGILVEESFNAFLQNY